MREMRERERGRERGSLTCLRAASGARQLGGTPPLLPPTAAAGASDSGPESCSPHPASSPLPAASSSSTRSALRCDTSGHLGSWAREERGGGEEGRGGRRPGRGPAAAPRTCSAAAAAAAAAGTAAAAAARTAARRAARTSSASVPARTSGAAPAASSRSRSSRAAAAAGTSAARLPHAVHRAQYRACGTGVGAGRTGWGGAPFCCASSCMPGEYMPLPAHVLSCHVTRAARHVGGRRPGLGLHGLLLHGRLGGELLLRGGGGGRGRGERVGLQLVHLRERCLLDQLLRRHRRLLPTHNTVSASQCCVLRAEEGRCLRLRRREERVVRLGCVARGSARGVRLRLLSQRDHAVVAAAELRRRDYLGRAQLALRLAEGVLLAQRRREEMRLRAFL
eukprot:1534829-Rhodomonas_salina.1